MTKPIVLFSLFLALFSLPIKGQIVNIPDQNFKNALLNTNCADLTGDLILDSDVDTNNDGEIQVNEALAVKMLDVSDHQVSSLEGLDAFPNIIELYCSENTLSELSIEYLTQLKYVDCSNTALNGANLHLPNSIKTLVCNYSPITSLNLQGFIYLEQLFCSYNQLDELDLSGLVNLKKLECNGNYLDTLEIIHLSHLRKVSCQYNSNLKSLILQGLDSLEILNCANNKLTSLNLQEAPNLRFLYCQENRIDSLDAHGLVNLVELNCNSNINLKRLSVTGADSLSILECYDNQLDTLDLHGLLKLVKLDCSLNQLKNLDLHGLTNIQYLFCISNQLTVLDAQELINLKGLACASNNISQVFIKNGAIESEYYLWYNPLTYICCDEEQIDDIKYMALQYGLPNCSINSYCIFVPGGDYYTLQGNARIDADNNGCDENDPIYPWLKFDISNGVKSDFFFSDENGDYFLPFNEGAYSIAPKFENPDYFTASPSSIQVVFPADSSSLLQNFCITPTGVHHDVEVNLFPLSPARPGFTAGYEIVVKNKGNQVENGTFSLAFIDSLMTLESADIVPDLQTTGNLSWNFTDLIPFQNRSTRVYFKINSPTDVPPVFTGDVLSFSAFVNIGDVDVFQEDNTFYLQQTVVGSFDPNDKTCLEGTKITDGQVGKYLHYLIRFENTGTYQAENIVVQDVIDTTKFDISTLQLSGSSHSCHVRILHGNQVEFIFEHINLPFTEPDKHGFIAFKIKTKSGLLIGEFISNQADIFFDYNFPIRTNNATTKVISVVNTENPDFDKFKVSLHPNPTDDILYFKSYQTISKAIFFDELGRIIWSTSVQNQQVNVVNLAKGVYFVKLFYKNGFTVEKIEKL